jgi:hypothetical protein
MEEIWPEIEEGIAEVANQWPFSYMYVCNKEGRDRRVSKLLGGGGIDKVGPNLMTNEVDEWHVRVPDQITLHRILEHMAWWRTVQVNPKP